MKFSIIMVASIALVSSWACSSSSNIQERTKFTRIDSLTDKYLVLQDSVLQSWNRVIKIETDKSKALKTLVGQINSTNLLDIESTRVLVTQVEQLDKIIFTPKSLGNPHVVNEYDESCTSIFKHLSAITSAQAELSNSAEIKSTLLWIKEIQQSTYQHRSYYDSLASAFNEFVEAHRSDLKEIERNHHLDSKPLFNTQKAKH